MLSSLRDCFYRLVESFVTWCNHNHLKLNISKTNELVVDYQRNRRRPVVIQGEEVKRVKMQVPWGPNPSKLAHGFLSYCQKRVL